MKIHLRYERRFCMDIKAVYEKLFSYAESRDFAGYDPFDGLNSAYFQASPFKYLAPARLAWLQMVKRSARNLRPSLKVPEGLNSKGIALFALAELSRFRATAGGHHAQNAGKLLKSLSSLTMPLGDSKLAFGYNFDWQSRSFFAPKGTPTIVPTAFAAQALFEAFTLFENKSELNLCERICRFIVEDLNRPHENTEEVCFSYTPLDRSIIFNASLLAGETLANVGALTENRNYLDLAAKTARFAIRSQRDDGAWAYGSNLRNSWVDNFHTAYILLSLYRLQRLAPSLKPASENAIRKGFDFWLDNFFLEDGTPKYYDKETYPVDIHSAAAAIYALAELNQFDSRALPLAEKVAEWTIANMRDEEGYFYYQKLSGKTVRTPFMRWGQGWMALALARLMEAQG